MTLSIASRCGRSMEPGIYSSIRFGLRLRKYLMLNARLKSIPTCSPTATGALTSTWVEVHSLKREEYESGLEKRYLQGSGKQRGQRPGRSPTRDFPPGRWDGGGQRWGNSKRTGRERGLRLSAWAG